MRSLKKTRKATRAKGGHTLYYPGYKPSRQNDKYTEADLNRFKHELDNAKQELEIAQKKLEAVAPGNEESKYSVTTTISKREQNVSYYEDRIKEAEKHVEERKRVLQNQEKYEKNGAERMRLSNEKEKAFEKLSVYPKYTQMNTLMNTYVNEYIKYYKKSYDDNYTYDQIAKPNDATLDTIKEEMRTLLNSFTENEINEMKTSKYNMFVKTDEMDRNMVYTIHADDIKSIGTDTLLENLDTKLQEYYVMYVHSIKDSIESGKSGWVEFILKHRFGNNKLTTKHESLYIYTVNVPYNPYQEYNFDKMDASKIQMTYRQKVDDIIDKKQKERAPQSEIDNYIKIRHLLINQGLRPKTQKSVLGKITLVHENDAPFVSPEKAEEYKIQLSKKGGSRKGKKARKTRRKRS